MNSCASHIWEYLHSPVIVYLIGYPSQMDCVCLISIYVAQALAKGLTHRQLLGSSPQSVGTPVSHTSLVVCLKIQVALLSKQSIPVQNSTSSPTSTAITQSTFACINEEYSGIPTVLNCSNMKISSKLQTAFATEDITYEFSYFHSITVGVF